MNKGQLIESVAAELGEPKAAASRCVDAVFNSITKGLKQDESVTITGFGRFSKRCRAARTVRSPSTGEPIQVMPSLTVGFKPSQALRDAL